MALVLKINNTDYSSQVVRDSLEIEQILTSQVDTAHFQYRKYGSRSYVPVIGDDVTVFDGSTKIFGGTVTGITEESLSNPAGVVYSIEVTDYTFQLDSKLVSKSYTNQTVQQIIQDLVSTFASGFTTTNVVCSFSVSKIVFNQISISTCIKRLADVVRYDWYVDESKDVHFFAKYTNTAPYNLTDTSGNYVNESLQRRVDGTQIANVVKVRGGEYDGATYTDKITVNGSNSKSFKLPYKFSGLTIKVNNVSKTVGVDFVDDFTTKDVLYNYEERTFRFNSNLADGDVIEFSGNPKTPVLAIASDAASISRYGAKEKIIRDNTIEDLNVARKRAQAEIQAYKDELSYSSFQTYASGLKAGMVINLNSSKRGCNVDFIIRRILFRARSMTEFVYDVDLVTTKEQGLIEILQKLLEPDPLQASESEVSETIQTDIGTVTIAESITRGTPRADTATLTMSENLQKDPLGAGVEPTWVLGPYFPSSITDTKRLGRLDYSLKVY